MYAPQRVPYLHIRTDQMANGKFQMVVHLPFAVCHLNFEFLFGGAPPIETEESQGRVKNG
jgi:hypothetical protein